MCHFKLFHVTAPLPPPLSEAAPVSARFAPSHDCRGQHASPRHSAQKDTKRAVYCCSHSCCSCIMQLIVPLTLYRTCLLWKVCETLLLHFRYLRSGSDALMTA